MNREDEGAAGSKNKQQSQGQGQRMTNLSTNYSHEYEGRALSDKETTRDIWRKRKTRKKERGDERPLRDTLEETSNQKKNEWESWFLPFLPFVSCDLFQPRGCAYPPGRPAVGIYSSVGQPANKTHVDLQRNGEGHGPENSPLFCCRAHTCMCRKNPLHMQKLHADIHTLTAWILDVDR